LILFSEAVAAVVITVSVEVCAVFPLIVTELGARLQVGGSLAAAGLTEQLRFTIPVNPFDGVNVIAAVFPVVAPGSMLIAAVPPLMTKVGSGVTVRAMDVAAVKVPEVPVTVTVTGPPAVAEPAAVSVSTWVPANVPAANDAVTPLGKPVAARATLPVNPPTSVTEMVLVPLLPAATDTLFGAAESVKLGGTLTVRAMEAVAVRPPEVPVIVTGTGPPNVAVLLAVSVTTLEPVVGLVANAAVTPLGNPETASVTLPLNPLAPFTVIVSVLLLPWATDREDAEVERVKLGDGLTVTATLVDADKLPEIPVMVTVTGPPTVAVPLADRVSALELVAGLVANAAVTPLGKPDAESITLPLNPFARVIVMVSGSAAAPWTTARLVTPDESVKLGGAFTVSATVVEPVRDPEVPLIVTVTGPPSVAVLDAVSVSTLELVAGFVAKPAVTPLGNPDAVRVTPPVNPPTPDTVIVLVPLLP